VPSVRRLDEGPLRTGTRAKIRQPHIPEAEYVVTELEPGRSFTWIAIGPGVLTTAHHDAEPPPDGGTRGAVGVPDRRASCGDGTFLPRTDRRLPRQRGPRSQGQARTAAVVPHCPWSAGGAMTQLRRTVAVAVLIRCGAGRHTRCGRGLARESAGRRGCKRRGAFVAGYQVVKPVEGLDDPARRVVLDTNVAIDIEDFYYGRARVRSRVDELREVLHGLSAPMRTTSSVPDVNYAWAVLEACTSRTSGVDVNHERRMRRALQVVLGWTQEEIARNFSNRHPPANRDRLLKKGLPIGVYEESDARPGQMLIARYGALLFLSHIDRSRSGRRNHKPLESLKAFVDWMTFDLGVRGVYETQLALDLLIGDRDRKNGARRLLKLSGAEDPETLANRAWNAAWDLEFLSLTERWSFGLEGSVMADQVMTHLLTRNLDPGFIRMHSAMVKINRSAWGSFPSLSLDWGERPEADEAELKAILLAGLSPQDLELRLAAEPKAVAARARRAIRDLEREIGVTHALLG
jgi:hypothetical protein